MKMDTPIIVRVKYLPPSEDFGSRWCIQRLSRWEGEGEHRRVVVSRNYHDTDMDAFMRRVFDCAAFGYLDGWYLYVMPYKQYASALFQQDFDLDTETV